MTDKKPTVRIEAVSPQLADKWLGTQQYNRRLREDRVAHWVALIERGEWRLSNDALAFDESGHLINGQHRLTSVVVTEQTLPFIVARNLPVETQEIMDSGLTRQMVDALRARGETGLSTLASVLRWEHRFRIIEASDGIELFAGRHGDDRATTPSLLAIFEADPDSYREAAHEAGKVKTKVRIRPALAALFWRRFHHIDAGIADAFFDCLMTGANLRKDDPVLQLRAFLMSSKARGAGPGARTPDFREAALICKAWNLWRDGDRRGALKWNYGPLTKEAFPLPH